MTTTTAIALTGYSRAGKTTSLDYLKSKGFQVISTSDYLNELTIAYFNLDNSSGTLESDFKAKKDSPELFNLLGQRSIRNAKIFVAEEIIVPTYGRLEGLVRPAFKKAEPLGQKLVFEVLNKEEAECYERVARDLVSDIDVKYVQLRSDRELIGVDIREPIGVKLFNNGSKEDLYRAWDRFLLLM